MKNFSVLMKYNIFFYLLLISSLNPSIKCEMSYNELINYYNNITFDRARQIYWNIVLDLEKIENSSNIDRNKEENYLFSLNRKSMLENMSYYHYKFKELYFNKDLNYFEKKMKSIDLFKLSNIDYLFSNQMPRNFLINFAVNIDKFERIKTHKIDGISDYINYLTTDRIIDYLKQK